MEINKLLAKEQVMWKQRYRMQWLQASDQNTTFFHNKASSRRHRNRIERIQNEEGVCLEEDETKRVITNYFRDIFTSSNLRDLHYFLDSFKPCITPYIAAVLQEVFIKEEVLESLHQIHPTEAPGLDGIPTFLLTINFSIL